jgi:hypothetical protein
MEISQIIIELESERDRLTHVIDLLRGDAKLSGNSRRRHLSSASKRRISEAMKKAWAERKRAAKAA